MLHTWQMSSASPDGSLGEMTPVLAFCVFCNSVRDETSGAITIVGIHPDTVLVRSFPGMFPSMTIYAKLAFPMDSPPKGVAVKIVNPDGSLLRGEEMPDSVLEQAYSEARQTGAPNANVSIEMDITPFAVKAAGRFLVNLATDEGEFIIGHLNLALQTQPNPAPSA